VHSRGGGGSLHIELSPGTDYGEWRTMPKICEICKQPYDDKLTSCPNCDIVDIFGGSAPTVPGAASGTKPGTATPKAPAKPAAPGEDLPPTKVQGPIPPVGGKSSAPVGCPPRQARQ
jgi:hypothetical protein